MRKILTRTVTLILAAMLLINTPSALLAQTAPDAGLRVTISEEFIAYLLETQLADALEGQEMQIENPRLDIRPNQQLALTIATNLPPLGDVEPTITIDLDITDNHLDMSIVGIALQGLQVPATLVQGQIGPIEQMAEEQANSALADLAESAGIEVVGIRTTERLLTIYLRSAE